MHIKTQETSKIKSKNFSDSPKLPLLTSFKGQARAFLKAQDGCDGYCTYCTIPKTRPEVQSKPISEIIKEAQALVKTGHKEIVLTGCYKKNAQVFCVVWA